MPHRILFCIGVLPDFFASGAERRTEVFESIKAGFDDLEGRFSVSVLGTFDDDRLMVGPSTAFPWTSYILADAPTVEAAAGVCNILRETPVGEDRLWRYLRIEARVGRELFFGNR